MRIISTVPSQTELLFDLGLENQVVGITKFCVHPKEWFNSKERIGGTKNLNLKKIIDLSPDLIIANKEENNKEQILELQKHFDVFVSDVKTVNDNLELIDKIGFLTHSSNKATDLIARTKDVISKIKYNHERTAIYLIWKDPYMTIGGDTYIHSMLDLCGFQNLYFNDNRYPTTTLLEIKSLNPEYIFLSSEPFPFAEKHILEIQEIIPEACIKLVDGEAFSWYGSRMIKKAEYLKGIAQLTS